MLEFLKKRWIKRCRHWGIDHRVRVLLINLLSCSHARRPKDLCCPGLYKYVEAFGGLGRESQFLNQSLECVFCVSYKLYEK